MDKYRKQIIKIWMSRADERYKSPSSGYSEGFFYSDNLIFCFIAYEAYVFGKFQKAQMAENRRELSQSFQQLFEESINKNAPDDLKEALAGLKKEIDKSPLQDMTPNSTRASLELPNKKDLDRVLEIIYRVRSNLLHGGKELNQRDIDLIKSSYIILYHIMTRILNIEKLI